MKKVECRRELILGLENEHIAKSIENCEVDFLSLTCETEDVIETMDMHEVTETYYT